MASPARSFLFGFASVGLASVGLAFAGLAGFGLSPAALAHADEASWRYCLAFVPASHNVFITDVFLSAAEGGQLEQMVGSLMKHRGVAGTVVQCPRNTGDKITAINAQIRAQEFNQKLGNAIYTLPLTEHASR
jgi:hypothetical protein